MAAPLRARRVMFALFAFNLEIARAPWVTDEPMLAEMRLQWWRDVVTGDTAPAHDAAGPLRRLIQEDGLPPALLLQAIDARRWDIRRAPFADWPAFDAHLDASSGALFGAGAAALGASPDDPALRDVAWAGGLARWLLAVPELEARGRLPLPDGRPEAVRDLARRGLARLARARGARFGAATPLLRACWQAGPILRQAANAPERVAAGALGQSEFARRAGLLWRVARRGW